MDVNAKGNKGHTPLSSAAGNGNELVVKPLLKARQVDVGAEDIFLLTPLSYAAMGRNEVVRRLFRE